VLKHLDADSESAQSIIEEPEVLKAQVLHGIREEMAQKLTDIVFRRTALGIAGYPGEAALRTCATLVSKELGWNRARTDSELKKVKAVFSLGTADA
jgi:glycerol-3-phosphate dehydrogenase